MLYMCEWTPPTSLLFFVTAVTVTAVILLSSLEDPSLSLPLPLAVTAAVAVAAAAAVAGQRKLLWQWWRNPLAPRSSHAAPRNCTGPGVERGE